LYPTGSNFDFFFGLVAVFVVMKPQG